MYRRCLIILRFLYKKSSTNQEINRLKKVRVRAKFSHEQPTIDTDRIFACVWAKKKLEKLYNKNTQKISSCKNKNQRDLQTVSVRSHKPLNQQDKNELKSPLICTCFYSHTNKHLVFLVFHKCIKDFKRKKKIIYIYVK